MNIFIKKQEGVVLLVAMVFLVVLSLLAVQSSKTSINDIAMSGNLANHQLSFISADNELNSTAKSLMEADTLAVIVAMPSYNDSSSVEVDYLKKAAWANSASGVTNGQGVTSKHFIRFTEAKLQNGDALLEFGGGYGTNGSAGDTYYLYRVTTKGFGMDDGSSSVISSIVAIEDPDPS